MIQHWRTKMMIVPLIFKVHRHLRHQKIALSWNSDGTLNTKLENFHDTFFEQQFLN